MLKPNSLSAQHTAFNSILKLNHSQTFMACWGSRGTEYLREGQLNKNDFYVKNVRFYKAVKFMIDYSSPML